MGPTRAPSCGGATVAGLADLVGDGVPACELERLRSVDALLRAIPGPPPTRVERARCLKKPDPANPKAHRI